MVMERIEKEMLYIGNTPVQKGDYLEGKNAVLYINNTPIAEVVDWSGVRDLPEVDKQAYDEFVSRHGKEVGTFEITWKEGCWKDFLEALAKQAMRDVVRSMPYDVWHNTIIEIMQVEQDLEENNLEILGC